MFSVSLKQNRIISLKYNVRTQRNCKINSSNKNRLREAFLPAVSKPQESDSLRHLGLI